MPNTRATSAKVEASASVDVAEAIRRDSITVAARSSIVPAAARSVM